MKPKRRISSKGYQGQYLHTYLPKRPWATKSPNPNSTPASPKPSHPSHHNTASTRTSTGWTKEPKLSPAKATANNSFVRFEIPTQAPNPAFQIPQYHKTPIKKVEGGKNNNGKKPTQLTINFHPSRRPHLPPNLKRHPQPRNPRHQTLLLAPPSLPQPAPKPPTKLSSALAFLQQNPHSQSLALPRQPLIRQRRARRRHALASDPRRDRRKGRHHRESRT